MGLGGHINKGVTYMEIGKIAGFSGGHTIIKGHINAFFPCAKMWGHKNIHAKMRGHKKVSMGSQKGPAILTCTGE